MMWGVNSGRKAGWLMVSKYLMGIQASFFGVFQGQKYGDITVMDRSW
jgi:hypothetical protein